jgi:molybdopterin/thiamine biosynthesis adenylyltransferase
LKNKKIPSESLLKGRRAIEFIEGVNLIDDLQWNESNNKWILHYSVFLDEINDTILPKKTEWYILIDDEYPRGNISFFPSKINSLTQTFPHQLYNGEGRKDYPWRNGLVCLDTNVRSLGHLVANDEPFEENVRLSWYVERLKHWLKSASLNQLTLENEPFELVDFPESSALKLGFSENHQSFKYWSTTDIKYGIVELSLINPGSFLVRNFKSPQGHCFRMIKWGEYASQFKNYDKIIGSWILLNEVPHLKPWQAPLTWLELNEICLKQGIDLFKKINSLKSKQKYRNNIAHILLVGFPIKKNLNDDNSEIFWKGIEIPITFKTEILVKRAKLKANERKPDKQSKYMNKHENIKWMHSFNWSKESIMTRGILPKSLTSSKILQIGAGALGSSVSELLIRGGVEKFGIIDFDYLEMGNITRHTLLLNNLDNSKAEALMDRLNKSSLHSNVSAFKGSIQFNLKKNSEALEKYNVVLDCTGDDDVLASLESCQWLSPKRFVSISLGFGGKRLFIFTHVGMSFQNEVFKKLIDPWLRKEQNEYSDEVFPREGLGCWHPLFPARIDDVWLMAATAVKKFEGIFKEQNTSLLSVYEQQNTNAGDFEGLKLVEEVVYDG